MAPHTALAGALVESDRLYFELGARVEPLDGATLARVPSMEAAPAACVVHRVGDGQIDVDPRRWVSDVCTRLEALGCAVARVYLDGSSPRLAAALAEAGFRQRTEIGYVVLEPLPATRSDVSLRPVVTDADWQTKRDLHSSSVHAADGHLLSGPSWVELERTKCRTGRMQAFLVEVADVTCGAIAALEVDGLLRAKNVFVHPDRRRQGIGAAAMQLVSRRAQELDGRGTGIFGVEGRPGNALYVSLGMVPVVEQFEWSKRLRAG